MLRDQLVRMHRWTKSAGTAVEASLFGRVLRAAKNSSPDSLFSPWQEKCSKRISSGRASEKRSSICAWMTCAVSLWTTRTSNSPICGSPSTPASAAASASGPADVEVRRAHSRRWRRSVLCIDRSLLLAPGGVSADKQRNQSVLVGLRRLRKLQHVAVELHPHGPADSRPARQHSLLDTAGLRDTVRQRIRESISNLRPG